MTGKKIHAVVVDGDNTLWKGIAAESIGKSILINELKKGHLKKFLRGVSAGKKLKSNIGKSPGFKDISTAQLDFYSVLIQNDLGKINEMISVARKHIKRNILHEVSNLIFQISQEGIPVFLSTASGSTVAEAAKNLFNITDSVSNTELFNKDGNLTGVELTITNGQTKLDRTIKLLNKYDIKITDCVVIGDSVLDVPLFKSSRHAVFSPLAINDIKQIKSVTGATISSTKVYSITRHIIK